MNWESNNHSKVSIFSFFTKGFQIFSAIHSGLSSGASTYSFHALNTWTFFVPRSRRRIISGFFFVPLPFFAAFKAAWRGCSPVKIPCSVPSSSLKTKFLFSIIVPPAFDLLARQWIHSIFKKCFYKYMVLIISFKLYLNL